MRGICIKQAHTHDCLEDVLLPPSLSVLVSVTVGLLLKCVTDKIYQVITDVSDNP